MFSHETIFGFWVVTTVIALLISAAAALLDYLLLGEVVIVDVTTPSRHTFYFHPYAGPAFMKDQIGEWEKELEKMNSKVFKV